MKLIRAILAALFAVVAVSPANAAASYYQPTADLTALAHYGTSSPYVLHAFVSVVTINAGSAGASYTWNAACPGSPDGLIYVAATGMGSGCWVLEGLAVADTSVAVTDKTQSFTKSQRATSITLALSGATATPNFNNSQNFKLTLTSACPCTLANPSTTLVAGQTGILEIDQDGTGSRLVSVWGSEYFSAGGTSTILLSTGANARDFFSYFVADTSTIVLSLGVSNATH